MGTELSRNGQRVILYLTLCCHHQNDFGITMGSEEGHFNVSLDVKEKVIKTVSINHNG